MDIKKEFYKLNKEDFDKLINSLINCRTTLSFSLNNKKYYFYEENEINNLLIELHLLDFEFNLLINSFSSFSKDKILESFMLNEIEATNKIENLNTKKDEIYQELALNNQKVASIASSYMFLYRNKGIDIINFDDLRNIYLALFNNLIDKENQFDGTYFRKNEVSITDGIKVVHKGINGEKEIEESMSLFLSFYNEETYDIYLRMIISHFIFETIHPYYDGNGRMGRFLFSSQLYKDKNTEVSFLISYIFHKYKSRYYKAFKKGRDIYEFGFINEYVKEILLILIDGLKEEIEIYKGLKEKRNLFVNNLKLSKNENKIYELIEEATLFSFYGINNETILKESGCSKRTLMYVLKDIKNKGILISIKFLGVSYHKFLT